MMKLMRYGVVVLFAACAFASKAKESEQVKLFPVYTPTHMMQGLYQYWLLPNGLDFVKKSTLLTEELQNFCQQMPDATTADIAQKRLDKVKLAWRNAAFVWERLSTVSIGPLITRRSQKQIDFTPTRPPMITAAIASAPVGDLAMEKIGTPAKGFPALEWLIWKDGLQSQMPNCHYSIQLALHIQHEAEAIVQDVIKVSQQEWTEEHAQTSMAEFVNQWVGALEKLRWQHVQKPLEMTKRGGRKEVVFPRDLSESSVLSWKAQWHTLVTLANMNANDVPEPGRNLVPLDAYLYGKGQIALAKQLQNLTQIVELKIKEVSPQKKNELLAFASALGQLKGFIEGKVSPALQIHIGFSDADGD